MGSRESYSDHAPQPVRVEWGIPISAFSDSAIANLAEGLRRLSEYDVVGKNQSYDASGYGTQGFPEAVSNLMLPDGTDLSLRVALPTMAEMTNAQRFAPWGGHMGIVLSRRGGFVLERPFLHLSGDWQRPVSINGSPVTLISAGAQIEKFQFIGMDLSEDGQVQKGVLHPGAIPEEEIPMVLLPGEAEFVRSLAIVFWPPAAS